jgi:small multidrug resistance pump
MHKPLTRRIYKKHFSVFIITLHPQSYTVVNFLQSFTPTLTQAWALLSVAIVFEVAGTTSMKLSHGFTHLAPSILMFACYAAAFSCNALVVKTLDLSITYAVWSGVGTVATAAIGIFWFREPATALKLVCISFIVMGVFGLHAASRLQNSA